MMNKVLIGMLVLAFMPGILLIVVAAVSTVRSYGLAFLWCLRFEPVHDKLTSMLCEMPAAPVVTEAEYMGQEALGMVIPLVTTPKRSGPRLRRRSY
jgi:hypothetical protein